MSFDRLIVEVGECGRFQRISVTLLWLISVFFAMHTLAMVFLAAAPKHHCAAPTDLIARCGESASMEALLNFSVPWEFGDSGWERSKCSAFARNYSAIPSASRNESDCFGSGGNVSEPGVAPCKVWVYSKKYHSSTIVTQWDLVCGKTWMTATGQSTFMFGLLLGCAVFGYISDRFGRRFTIVLCTLIQTSAGVATAFSPNYLTFILLRFFVAMATAGQKNSSYIMIMELTGPSKRPLASMLSEFFWSAGYTLLGLLAYLIPDWRSLQLVISAPAVFILSYQWLLPESPLWLLTKGKTMAAERLFRKMAKCNKRAWNPKSLRQTLYETQDSPSGSVLDLVRTRNIRQRSFALWLIWFVGSFGFFGLSFHTATLDGNIFVNYFISALVEVPGFGSAMLATRKWGRRLPLGIGLTVGGLACLSTILVPPSLPAVTVTLAVIGKFGMCVFFAIIYIFTAELYPTGIRNVGLGMGSFFARVGGIAAPYVGFLGYYYSSLPLIIYGGMSVVAGLIAFLLPETLNCPLPDSVQEAEDFGGLAMRCHQCKKKEIGHGKEAYTLPCTDDVTVTGPEKRENGG